MSIEVTILSGIVIAIGSATIGRLVGGYNKVSNKHCNERRSSCNALILSELRNLKELFIRHLDHHEKTDGS